MGGGFGRRYEWDFVSEAVLVAKAVGRPVNLVWPREEDIRHDFYRPPAMARITGLIDNGMLRALDAFVAGPSANLHAWPQAVVDGVDRGALEGLIDLPYDIAGLRVQQALTPIHLNVGFWRSVSFSYTLPFVETFMDSAAAAAGSDPLAFRLRHLAHDERGSRVLRRCAELAGYDLRGFGGEAIGIAFGRPMLTPTAVAAAIRRSGDRLVVQRIVAVVDCGLVINPDTVRAQMEGGALFGVIAALDHRVTVENGAVVESNFHDVPLMTVGDAPEVVIDVIPSDADPTGIGEATTPVTMAAVANAAAALLGRPVHALPIHPL